jgi:zinc protease
MEVQSFRRQGVRFSAVMALALGMLGACRDADPRLPQQVPVPARHVATAPPAPVVGETAGRPTWLPSDPDATLPMWPAVSRRILPNGLTSYVMRHPHPKGRAFFWLAVHAGSSLEDDDQRGLAHFVEHMAFNGTKRFEEQAIVAWAESIGMRFGADVNAYTGFDATVYQLEVPTDKAEHVDRALDVLRDWMTDVTFDPAAIDAERGVVLEEWRLSRGVGERISDQHLPVLFKGTRHAERLPIGLPDIIRTAPREAMVRFYERFYRPENIAVIAVGDVDVAAIEKAIDDRFKSIVPANPAPPRPEVGLPEAGLRVSIARDAELPRASVAIHDILPHRREATTNDYRRGMAESLWQLVMGERMAAIERRPDAPFEDAGFGIDSPTHTIDMLSAHALARPGGVEAALRGLIAERLRAERGRFSEDEIKRARANLRRFYEDYDLTLDTVTADTFADEMTRNFFEGELMVGAAAEKALALAAIDSLSSDEIAAAGRTFAEGGRRVVLISAPQDEVVPDEERVRALFDEVAATLAVETVEEASASGPLVDAAPKPGAIVSKTRLEAVDVDVWTLSNGARVFVKKTDFAIDEVVVGAFSAGGLVTTDDATFPHARLALSALAQGGVGAHDVMGLARLLAGRNVAAELSVGDASEGLSARGSKRDLELLMQMIWLRFTAPRVDEAAIRLWLERSKTALAAESRSPEARFARELAAFLSNAHPRRQPPTPAELDAFDIEEALAFHRDRFGDVSDFAFAIIGDIDLATLEPLVVQWIGALPGAGRVETEKDPGIEMPKGPVTKEWRLGREPRASVQLHLQGDAPWSRDGDRDLRILADLLGTRLREVLREDLGGVYGVGVSGSFERRPRERWFLSIQFGCDPGRVDELIAAVEAELQRFQREAIDAAHLARLREIAIRSRETQLRDNDFWAAWLLASHRFGDDPALILDPAGYLARIDAEHVKAAAKRHLDTSAMIRVVLRPE